MDSTYVLYLSNKRWESVIYRRNKARGDVEEHEKRSRKMMYIILIGETLLSPLVMCGPHGTQFLKPVELKLPYCASMTPDGWSFALKSSDKPSGTKALIYSQPSP